MSRSRPLLVVVGLLALILAALATAQLLLPTLAARRLRAQLRGEGVVQHVTVRAFPAVKLLWGKADSVSVRMATLRVGRARTADLLARAGASNELRVTIGRLDEGLLTLHDVTIYDHAGAVSARGRVADAELQSALPAGFAVEPVASGEGRLLLRGRASLFGLGFSGDALLSARDGALVVQPVGIPLGALATLTVFADPRVVVEGVGAVAEPGGYLLSAQGRLAGG